MKKLVLFLFLTLSLSALSHPRGEYLVGDFDGEDFEFRMVFQNGNVLVDRLGEDWSSESVVEEAGPGRYRFSMELDEVVEITLISTGRNEFVLTTPTERTSLKGWRVEKKPLPSWLLGDWKTEGSESLRFNRDGMVVTTEGKNDMVRCFQLSSVDKVDRMILVPEERWSDGVLLHFHQIGQNQMLAWDQDDGDIKRFFRDGWISR